MFTGKTNYGETLKNNFKKSLKKEVPALQTQFIFHEVIPTKYPFVLLHRYTLRQVSWLIYITTAHDGDVIRK
jgi:hypothetical protein